MNRLLHRVVWVAALSAASGIGAWFGTAGAAGAQEGQTVEMSVAGSLGKGPKLGYGNCQWLYPHRSPQEKLLGQPDYGSDHPIYFAARYGDSVDNVFTLVLDESRGPGRGYDVVFLDADNDNRLDAETERFPFVLSGNGDERAVRLQLQVTAGGKTLPYHVDFTAFRYARAKGGKKDIHVNLRNSSYRAGTATLFGKRCKIAICDLDSNGLFNDVEQGLFKGDRLFVDLDGDGGFRDTEAGVEKLPYGGYTRLRDRWFAIKASPDGTRLTIDPAQPPVGTVKAPPEIVAAELRSAGQPALVTFAEGVASVVAGTYRIAGVKLGQRGSDWSINGSFPDHPKNLTVQPDGATELPAGFPLRVSVKTVPDPDGALECSLLITGAGGETYRWGQRNGAATKAGFKLVDAEGKTVVAEKFEYG